MISINESDRDERRVSPTTKVLIKKLNKGKKPDSKFWQSEFSTEDEKQPKSRVKEKGPSATKQILALVCGMLTGAIILFFYFRPDILRQNEIQLAPHLKETQNYSSIPKYNTSTSKPQYSQPADKKFNDNRTNTKYINPPVKTNSNRVQSNQRVSSTEKPPYQFEIELHSGGKIYTDNADIKDDAVIFTNHKGLVVSIKRGEIKDMKWVNAY